MSKEDVLLFTCYGKQGSGKSYMENLKAKDKEIERLNNIINELEKWLKERYDICKKNIDKMEYNEYSHNFYQVASNVNADRKDTLNKLQELKGSDKE